MSKNITKIVLTGGPAAGKTSLISRIIKDFRQEDGWRVITIPETATELISGFGIKPFGNCMSMLKFQDFVIADQIHKEKLALDAAEVVPEDNVLIIYDRALLDDKAYISDEEFAETLLRVGGRTEAQVLAGYDAVLHLVTCAKGAEFAYNLGNEARTESIEYAREMDDRTLRAWSGHHALKIIDNAENFEDKLSRGLREIYRVVGEPEPMAKKSKFLIGMPDLDRLLKKYKAMPVQMEQTFLGMAANNLERRVSKRRHGGEETYFFTEKYFLPDGSKLDTEKPITKKEYERYLLEADAELKTVAKTKYRFVYDSCRFEIDVYPFCDDKAVMFRYSENSTEAIPPEAVVIKDVTGDRAYKNRQLARVQKL